jgi:hypothetical protein
MYYICGLWPLRNTKVLIPNMVSEPRSRASTARRNSCFDLKFSFSPISFGRRRLCLVRPPPSPAALVSGRRCPLLRLRPPSSPPRLAAVSAPFWPPPAALRRQPAGRPVLGPPPSPAFPGRRQPFLAAAGPNRLPALAGRRRSLPGSTTPGIVNS